MSDYFESDSGCAVPDTSNEILLGKGFKINSYPLSVEIDKEYYRKKFEKVIERYQYGSYLSDVDKEDLLNELMKCFDEGK